MKYKPKITLPKAVNNMFIYQETDNTIRVRIDSDNIMVDLERCVEIINQNVSIEKISEEEELEAEKENDD